MNSTKNREKNDATTTTTRLFELIINDHEKFKGERERERINIHLEKGLNKINRRGMNKISIKLNFNHMTINYNFSK